MGRRYVRGFLLAALLILNGKAWAADSVRYVLDWFPSGEETYAYVATQEGFFAHEGLDVKLSVSRGSSDAITRVAADTADFTGASIGALMAAAAENRVPVKALMSIYSKPPDATFTVKGSGIASIKDLAGRSVVTGIFTSSNEIWPVLAALNGIDPAKVSITKVDPNTIAALLAAGRFRCLDQLGVSCGRDRRCTQEGWQGTGCSSVVRFRPRRLRIFFDDVPTRTSKSVPTLSDVLPELFIGQFYSISIIRQRQRSISMPWYPMLTLRPQLVTCARRFHS